MPMVAHDLSKAILMRTSGMGSVRKAVPISPTEPPYDNLLQCAAVIPILRHCLWPVLQQGDGAESRVRLLSNVGEVATRMAKLKFTDHGHQLLRGGLVASLDAMDEVLQAAVYVDCAAAGDVGGPTMQKVAIS